MTVRIIGCGYIGKKIAQQLGLKGKASYACVNSEKSLHECNRLGFEAERVNLDEAGFSPGTAEAMHAASVIYLVPPPPAGLTDSRMTRFIDSLKQSGSRPRRLILVSTTGVYGDCQGRWIDEMEPLNPQADRAVRRVDAEQQLSEYCQQNNIDNIIFRVPGIYAADKLPLKRIGSGEPIVCAEDSGFTNRIHADDLASFCTEALLAEPEPGIYNCCDGSPSTMNDYFMKVAKATGMEPPQEITLEQAQLQLSPGMLSYLAESKRISNQKLLASFQTTLRYPDLEAGLRELQKD